MKKQLQFTAILFLLFTTQTIYAQWDDDLWVGKQADNWVFYLDAGLNFSTSPPTVLTNCNTVNYYIFGEGTGTISDSSGNLLFSTSIDTIFNKNHQMMQNGYCILNDVSSTQTGLTVPKPGPGNEYYIFQIGDNGLGWTSSDTSCSGGPLTNIPELAYTVVDMDMDNGLGAVTSKNNSLVSNVSEKLTAVHHADGEQIWIITHEGTADPLYSSNNFLAFLISSSGIDPTPVVSSVGVSTDLSLGQLKVSPDGSKIAFVTSGTTQYLQVFDFDNATGQISNPIDLTSAIIAPSGGLIAGAWGVEFSPNSRYLYMTEMGMGLFYSRLHQLDLQAGSQAAILASDTLLEEIIPAAFSSLQLAPDGKIYMANPTLFYPGTTGHLSVIHNPNNAGAAANFEHLAVDLQGKNCSFGLPNFVQSYFESGILHEGDCAGQAVTFSTLRIPDIESVDWDFGDPDSGADNTATSSDGISTHVFNEPGTYTITATITSNGAQQTTTTEIEVLSGVEAFPPENIVACDDGTGTAAFDLIQQNAIILGNQDPNTHTISYHTAQTDAENNINPIGNPTTFLSSGQTIYVRVTTAAGCYGVTQFDLEVAPLPSLPNDLELIGCAPIDLTQIAEEVGGDLSLGYYTSQADAEGETNAIANARQYDFEQNERTIYLRGETSAGCVDVAALHLIREECIIPQGISPNGDQWNQNFDLSHLNIANLEIFNRYGRSVFNMESYTNEWFGQADNGDELPTGTYFYVIELKEGETFKDQQSLTGWVYVNREIN